MQFVSLKVLLPTFYQNTLPLKLVFQNRQTHKPQLSDPADIPESEKQT